MKEGLEYVYVKAMAKLLAITVRKMKILEEHKIPLLMTTPNIQVIAPTQECFKLQQEKTFLKL